MERVRTTHRADRQVHAVKPQRHPLGRHRRRLDLGNRHPSWPKRQCCQVNGMGRKGAVNCPGGASWRLRLRPTRWSIATRIHTPHRTLAATRCNTPSLGAAEWRRAQTLEAKLRGTHTAKGEAARIAEASAETRRQLQLAYNSWITSGHPSERIRPEIPITIGEMTDLTTDNLTILMFLVQSELARAPQTDRVDEPASKASHRQRSKTNCGAPGR